MCVYVLVDMQIDAYECRCVDIIWEEEKKRFNQVEKTLDKGYKVCMCVLS